MSVLLYGLCFIFCVDQVSGNGRLLDPVGRASAWRLGYNTPHNYDDNSVFCGGLAAKANAGGKCGVCGDPYNGMRDNEPPNGKYATGVIVKSYKEGQIITTKAEITANHFGYMEFRICPHNDVHTPVTQECLDQHVLQRADGLGSRVNLTGLGTGYFKMEYQLPPGMTCSQCVIQWRYHAGNNWGCGANAQCCIGCGMQQEYYACADVAIFSDGTFVPISLPSTLAPITMAPTSTPTSTVVTGISLCYAINLWAGDPNLDKWCRESCAIGNCPPLGCQCGDKPTTQKPTTLAPTITSTPTTMPTTTTSTTTTPKPTTPTTTTTTTTPKPTTPSTTRLITTGPTTTVQACKAINLWAGSAYLDKWCTDACARGNCPADSCSCSGVHPKMTHLSTRPSTPQPTTSTPTSTSTPTTTSTSTTTSTTTTTTTTTPTPTTTTKRTTTKPTTTSTTTTLAATTTSVPRCKAVGDWAGNDYLDEWCSVACSTNICPPETCSCSNQTAPTNPTMSTVPPTTSTTASTTASTTTPATTPATTSTTTTSTTTPTTPKSIVQTTLACKAISLWANIDVFDRWCMDECSQGNCPPETCNCTNTPLFPLFPAGAPLGTSPGTAGPKVICPSNGKATGAYWTNWCQQSCDSGYCPVDYCNCSLKK